MTGNIQRQRGVTLIVVLILVLLVTLAGVAAVRSLVVEERMAANSLDRSLAMQSLEQTLRYAEGVASAQSQTVPFNSNFSANSTYYNGFYTGTSCTATATTDESPCTTSTDAVPGLCSTPTLGCNPRWTDAKFSRWATWNGTGSTLADLNKPQYIIEFLGRTFKCRADDPQSKTECAQYRITVRTAPSAGRAFVQLQSYYLAFPR